MPTSRAIWMLAAAAGIGFVAVIVGAWLFLDRQPAAPLLPASGAPMENSEAQIQAVHRALNAKGVLALAIERFHITLHRYPRNLEELSTRPSDLPREAHWDGPYVNNPKLLIDPWGHAYNYAAPGKHNEASYDLWSAGLDGVPNTVDDMGNW